MSNTGGIRNPNTCRYERIIDWNLNARSVSVCGSWDDFAEWTTLQTNGVTHWGSVYVEPGVYDIYFWVDGAYAIHPTMSRRLKEDGRTQVNILEAAVPLPLNALPRVPPPPGVAHPRPGPYGVDPHLPEVLVPIKFHQQVAHDEHVLVEGSWDDWKLREPMEKAGSDHYFLKSLHPGCYPYKYIVKGERKLSKDAYRGTGIYEGTNILQVLPDPATVIPQGVECSMLDNVLALPNTNLTQLFKFNVGAEFGDIDTEVALYPMTPIGYLISNGFIGFAKSAYLGKRKSWAGTFKPSDMVMIDKRYCMIMKEPTHPLTRVNLLLDNLQMKKTLLQKYKTGGQFPPYFVDWFYILDNPPADFDTSAAARSIYFDCWAKPAALATSPERMHLLVSVAQFFKQLSDNGKTYYARLFVDLLPVKPNIDWEATVRLDALMESVFMERKKDKEEHGIATKSISTSLELSYFLRVFFFVHVPQHTLSHPSEPVKLPCGPNGKRPVKRRADVVKDKSTQRLESHMESDLITFHYFERCVGKLVYLVRKHEDKHPLLHAAWESYCANLPPVSS